MNTWVRFKSLLFDPTVMVRSVDIPVHPIDVNRGVYVVLKYEANTQDPGRGARFFAEDHAWLKAKILNKFWAFE